MDDIEKKLSRVPPMKYMRSATPSNHEQLVQSYLDFYRKGLESKTKDALLQSLIKVSNRADELEKISDAKNRGIIGRGWGEGLEQYAGAGLYSRDIINEHVRGLGRVINEYEQALIGMGMSLEEVRGERIKARKEQEKE